MPIRIRLTLWYTGVLAAILLLFGLAVYVLLSLTLNNQVNRRLHETAEGIIGGSRVLSSFWDQPRLEIPQLDAFSASTIYVQVWDVHKRLVARTDNLRSLRTSLDGEALQREEQTLRDVLIGQAHLRVLTTPLYQESDGVLVGHLQVATSLRTLDNARRGLLVILISGGLIGIILSAVLGALLAERALRPIDDITQTALQITRADDLSRRIPQADPFDEVGRLAGAFNEMLERLERLFRAQQRFVADVSHELRTPLTTIRGNVDLLRRMGQADPACLDAIQAETERMTRLVGDLLLLARADAGQLPLAQEPVEVDLLMADLARQAQLLARERVKVSLTVDGPAIVRGDADRLRQLLLNLVDNALKHTPPGGRIWLRQAQADGWVRLTVYDTGKGIAPEDLPHIFDRFYRADKARSRSHGGAGLGLSIARWIAEAHGGRIEVQSELDVGSAFHVWLPLEAPEER